MKEASTSAAVSCRGSQDGAGNWVSWGMCCSKQIGGDLTFLEKESWHLLDWCKALVSEFHKCVQGSCLTAWENTWEHMYFKLYKCDVSGPLSARPRGFMKLFYWKHTIKGFGKPDYCTPLRLEMHLKTYTLIRQPHPRRWISDSLLFSYFPAQFQKLCFQRKLWRNQYSCSRNTCLILM